MRLKFGRTCHYKQVITDEDVKSGKFPADQLGKIKTTTYEAGKEYDLTEEHGYANRFLRRGAEVVAVATKPAAKAEPKSKD